MQDAPQKLLGVPRNITRNSWKAETAGPPWGRVKMAANLARADRRTPLSLAGDFVSPCHKSERDSRGQKNARNLRQREELRRARITAGCHEFGAILAHNDRCGAN